MRGRWAVFTRTLPPVPKPMSGPFLIPSSLDPSSTLHRGEDNPLSWVQYFRVTERFSTAPCFLAVLGDRQDGYSHSNRIDEVSEKLGPRLVMGFAVKATHSNGTSGILTHILCHLRLWSQRGT